MSFFSKKDKSFTFNNFRWTTKDIVQNAFFIALWPVFGFFTLPLRVLDINIPFFYFLIWFAGFVFHPYHAFISGFLGHLMFDLIWSFSPLFVFIWLASGFSSMFISLMRKNSKYLFSCLFVLPFSYICGFFILSLIVINPKFWLFFQIFPHITITLIVINPIFNIFVFYSFKKNLALKKLLLFCQQQNLYNWDK